MHRDQFPRFVYHPAVPNGIIVWKPEDCDRLEKQYGVEGWVETPGDLPPAQAETPQASGELRPPSFETVMAAGYGREAAASMVSQEWKKFSLGIKPYGDKEETAETFGVHAPALATPAATTAAPEPEPIVDATPTEAAATPRFPRRR